MLFDYPEVYDIKHKDGTYSRPDHKPYAEAFRAVFGPNSPIPLVSIVSTTNAYALPAFKLVGWHTGMEPTRRQWLVSEYKHAWNCSLHPRLPAHRTIS